MLNFRLLLTSIFSIFFLQFTCQEKVIKFNKGFKTVSSNIDQYKLNNEAAYFGGYYFRFITFNNIPNQDKLTQINEAGIQLMEYVPDNTYLSAIPNSISVISLNSLGVFSIQEFENRHKTSNRLDKGNFPDWAYKGKLLNLSVRTFTTVSFEKSVQLIETFGAKISLKLPHSHMMNIEISEEKLNQLIALPYIRFIDLISEPGKAESDDGRNLHRSNAIDNDYFGGLNYDGDGIAIAINDDGFVGPHIDFTGRVNQQDVAGDFTGTHGDMTAGIAGGAGNLDPLMRGMAPASYLHIRQYNANMSGTIVLHQDSAVMVFNSSYSNGCNAGYTNTTLLVDQEIYNNPSLMQTFSAGNSNNNDCGYGAGDQWGNITGGHKIGKNVIATANLNEIDVVLNSSSRGPASDGRIKPDLSAHGNSQMSTDPNISYAPGGGTSAAAPGICGVMAQLHQAYKELNSGATASSALLKSALLNTANDLGNDGPDFIYGWGKVNALKALKLIEDNRYFSASVAQGDSNIHSITIPSGVLRAKIMVYWADQQASTSSSYALVNDLDASVSSPSNFVHLPWVLDHSPNPVALADPAGRGEDHLNNMEQVAINNPSAGSYELKVKGTTLPFGNHNYIVLYEFLYDDITVTFPMGGEGLLPGTQDRIHWDAYESSGTFLIEYSPDGGNNWSTINTVPGSSRFTTWTVPTTYTGQGRIKVSRGAATDQSDANFSIMDRPENIRINRVCPNQNLIQIAWDSVANATSYDVFMLGSKFMDSIGSSSGLSFNAYVADVNLDYWFSVRANGANETRSLRQIAIEYNGSLGGTASCFLSCEGDNDAGIKELISPTPLFEICNGATSSDVEVTIENIGLFDESNIPIYYQINNDSIVQEIVAGPLSAAGTLNYTFSNPFTFNNPGLYTLKIWTGLANDSTFCNDTIVEYIEVTQPYSSYPYAEDFETGTFPPNNLTLINPDNDLTWQQTGVTGADGNPTSAVYVNNFAYNAAGQEDIMQILSMDLTNGDSANLTFDYAYVLYSATYSDDLRIDISTDCGLTYSQLFFKNGATLSGGQSSTGSWEPSSAGDWQNETIDLNNYLGNNITLRFVNITGYGNNLYIDNINVTISGLPPFADFQSNLNYSCEGAIDFIDLSGNYPNQWLWEFGDGQTSSIQNPSHNYTSDGIYNVSLTASNSLGSDYVTKNAFVIIEYPNVATIINGEGCINTTIELSAINGNGELYWYDANNTLVHIGDTLITPPLDSSLIYTVKDVIEKPTVNAGPLDNNFGTGGYHGSTFYGAINFTADTSFTIISAWVDADGAGDRTIYLWDGNVQDGGNTLVNPVLSQVTVSLNDGPQRINLNMEVPQSGNYSIGGNQMNLYRNNSGPTYPYISTDLLSLTSSSANSSQDYYYYLYDWEIKTAPCESPLQQVTANVVETNFEKIIDNNIVYFTDNSTGAYSWLWDFGDGSTSTQQNPIHVYNSTGTYNVTLTINSGSCATTNLVDIMDVNDAFDIIVMPNPATDYANVIFTNPISEEAQVGFFSVDGKLIWEQIIEIGTDQINIDMTKYSSAVYLIRIKSENFTKTRRILKR